MGIAVLSHRGDGFTIGYLWLTDFCFNAIGAFKDVDFDVEMQLAHALEDGLARIFIGFHPEGRVFCDHLANRCAQLFCLTLVFWLYRNGDNGIRENHRL